jgi:hypothetical protein
MPNWCSNFVAITGPKERIAQLKEAYDNGEFCNSVIPVPQELKDAVADGSTNDELVAKYGYSNWYDFCVNRWGTKWDFGGDGAADVDDNGECLTISFDSAWSPPCGIYEELDLEGLHIEACYYEGGMGYCGMWTSESGDDYYDISNMSADQVADMIPQELDDCMGITETMREYEDPEELSEWLKDGIEARKQEAE